MCFDIFFGQFWRLLVTALLFIVGPFAIIFSGVRGKLLLHYNGLLGGRYTRGGSVVASAAAGLAAALLETRRFLEVFIWPCCSGKNLYV